MIQIRHVPVATHRRLKSKAALAGMSLSDFLRLEVEQLAAQPTMEELKARLARLSPVTTRLSSAALVRAERDRR